MSMEINKVVEQMRALNTNLRPPIEMNPVETSQGVTGPGFGDVLKQAIEKVSEQQSAAGTLVKGFQTGSTDTSIAEVMVSMQKASVSFQAMAEVRNRLVDAYREVMNMPI